MKKKSNINKHLFVVDFSLSLKGLAWFSVVVGLLMFLVLALFPSVADIFADVPDDIKHYLVFDDINAYFSNEAMSIWLLIGSIFAVWVGARLSSGDFKKGNAELIYSLNMGRLEIFWTKALVVVVDVTIFSVVMWLFSFVGLWIFGGKTLVAGSLIYLLLAWVLCLAVAFLTFGWGFATRRKFSTIVGWIIVVVLYVFTSLSPIVEWLGYLSPFTALNGDILTLGWNGVQYYGLTLVVWLCIALLTTLLSSITFKRADID